MQMGRERPSGQETIVFHLWSTHFVRFAWFMKRQNISRTAEVQGRRSSWQDWLWDTSRKRGGGWLQQLTFISLFALQISHHPSPQLGFAHSLGWGGRGAWEPGATRMALCLDMWAHIQTTVWMLVMTVIVPLPLTSKVTLGKWFYLSKPQFVLLQSGAKSS